MFPQFLVCKRKLESKKEALLILSKELDTCQQERDQYRLMANQLRERHQGLKKKYRELIVSQQGSLCTQLCLVVFLTVFCLFLDTVFMVYLLLLILITCTCVCSIRVYFVLNFRMEIPLYRLRNAIR